MPDLFHIVINDENITIIVTSSSTARFDKIIEIKTLIFLFATPVSFETYNVLP